MDRDPAAACKSAPHPTPDAHDASVDRLARPSRAARGSALCADSGMCMRTTALGRELAGRCVSSTFGVFACSVLVLVLVDYIGMVSKTSVLASDF